MTFKHGKFQDSAVMRSLEKVAREKGLVKDEDLVKSASQTKKNDLSPVPNLLINLIRLSAGLREAGFDKYADELEKKTLDYKSAQTLYEAHKEKGEDLVDAAHPKGSHKIEDIEGGDLAVIETIVDQHLANLKIVEKKPTGKLASSKDVLAAVRVVLGEDPSVAFSQNSINTLYGFTRKLSEMFNSMQFFNWENDTVVAFNRLNDFVNRTAASKVINVGTVSRIVALANDLKSNLAKETVLGMQSTAAKNATFHVNSLINFVQDTVLEEIKASVAATPKADENVQKFNSQIAGYLKTLGDWLTAVNFDPENSDDDKKQAGGWIEARRAELNDLKSKFKPEEAEGFLIALSKSKFVKESAQFKKTWIG